jgi:hypothetical protein
VCNFITGQPLTQVKAKSKKIKGNNYLGGREFAGLAEAILL